MPELESRQGDTAPPSAHADDATDPVRIDRTSAERWRYTCPNGHPCWDRTNNHIWCSSCQRQSENGVDVDPEHWHLYDKRDDKQIHWSHVEIIAE